MRMQESARSKLKGGDKIEKLINSSLDDIVKQTQRERRMRRNETQRRRNGNINNKRTMNGGAVRKKGISELSRGKFKGSQKRNDKYTNKSMRFDNNNKVGREVRGTRTRGGGIGGRTRGGAGGRGIERRNAFGANNKDKGGNVKNNNFGYNRNTNKDKVRNIKIVAKLDDVPAPTAQQKAGIGNLEIAPSSILSRRSKGRVFG
ncbi:hypothetical protein FG379_000238 [Cryptosporidium bovis]|uniref:uncharacterized protein n=1 Tax=Cryptosporidium bovis TaxID=310047 RepID=UPI00351AA21F|nr:hypothetical protein FG379_000238 [Cryptosporidium bovis]